MKHINLDSSHIVSIAHDSLTNTLEIKFHKGGIYTYKDFPREKFDEFIDASSYGHFFHRHIKPFHKGIKKEI